MSRTIKAVFRWVRSENSSSPASFFSLLPLARTPTIRLTIFTDRFRVHRSPFDHPPIAVPYTDRPSRVGIQRSRLSLTAGETLLEIRFSVYSEPRAELRLQNRGGVGSAHYSKMVQQICHRRRFPVPRLPQIEDMLGRAGLSREIIDVPVTRTKTPAAWLPRKVVQADISSVK